MDSIAKLAARMADRGGYDIRLEAAAAKEWNTVRAWEIVDQTLQIRGGRGYETERSLAGRGETPIPVERHDARLPHQPDLRGLERDHAPLHGARGGRQAPPGRRRDDRSEERVKEKLAAMPKILGFYAGWYPPLWLRGLGTPGRYSATSARWPAPALRRAQRAQAARARASTAWRSTRPRWSASRASSSAASTSSWSCSRWRRRSRARAACTTPAPPRPSRRSSSPTSSAAMRRKVGRLFRDLWSNDDAQERRRGERHEREHAWLEEGASTSASSPSPSRRRFMTRPSERGPSAAAGSALGRD